MIQCLKVSETPSPQSFKDVHLFCNTLMIIQDKPFVLGYCYHPTWMGSFKGLKVKDLCVCVCVCVLAGYKF